MNLMAAGLHGKVLGKDSVQRRGASGQVRFDEMSLFLATF